MTPCFTCPPACLPPSVCPGDIPNPTLLPKRHSLFLSSLKTLHSYEPVSFLTMRVIQTYNVQRLFYNLNLLNCIIVYKYIFLYVFLQKEQINNKYIKRNK